MEKRKRNRKEQEKLHEQQASKTPFQKMLEDRAKRLEKIVSNFNIIFGLRKEREMEEKLNFPAKINLEKGPGGDLLKDFDFLNF